MRSLAVGVLITAAIFAAVAMLPATQAEAARVRIHVGGYYPSYYGSYGTAYGPGYYGPRYYGPGYYGPGYYGPPVRGYSYRPPVVYAPGPPIYVAPPAYVPLPPAPPCVHYRVWER